MLRTKRLVGLTMMVSALLTSSLVIAASYTPPPTKTPSTKSAPTAQELLTQPGLVLEIAASSSAAAARLEQSTGCGPSGAATSGGQHVGLKFADPMFRSWFSMLLTAKEMHRKVQVWYTKTQCVVTSVKVL